MSVGDCPLGDWGLEGRQLTWGAAPTVLRVTAQGDCRNGFQGLLSGPARQRFPPCQHQLISGTPHPRARAPTPSLWLSSPNKLQSSLSVPSLGLAKRWAR